ncbi:unnamed protein product [Victoria cruziana]
MASASGDNEDSCRGNMWALDQKFDQPMDEEAGKLKNMYKEKAFSSFLVLRLAFQSLGVVYGDLGTSPLYVFYSTFSRGIRDPEDVIGALSLIIYSLTLIPLVKYVFIVLRANDNGQGGTFALYSLICRHAKIKTIPNQHRTDEDLTTYSCHRIEEKSFAAKTKRWMEASVLRKNALLFLVLVGTCMVIGDGILTPAISVLSATGGIKVNHPKMSNEVVVIVSVVILIGLFSMQHYGTDRVGWLFAPIVLIWFISIGSIGAFNIWKYDKKVLKAFYPVYIYRYFKSGKKDSWVSLGGIMLSITGTAVVMVMLVTTFLMILIMLLVWKTHWALVLIFTVLSLAVELTYFSAMLFKVDQGGWVPLVISAAFLLIMYVWHYGTMMRYEFELQSRVSIAWILGLGPSLGLVRVPGIGFVYTELASGVPHIFSHLITNLPAIHSVVVFVCIKYLPVFTVPEEERFLVKRIGPKNFRMFRSVARYGYKDLHKKDEDFEKMLLHSIYLFVRLESMMEGVSDSEEYSLYTQTEKSAESAPRGDGDTITSLVELTSSSNDAIVQERSPQGTSTRMRSSASQSTEVDEVEFLNSCRDAGVVHILGNTVVTARRDSGIIKKLVINYLYAFLRKICRQNSVMFNVPHESLLNVGQVFYV